VSERFSKARLDHEQKLAQYRKQQDSFSGDDEPEEEILPAGPVVEEQSDGQADEEDGSQPLSSQATPADTSTEEQREDELEPDSIKVREEDEDEFYVP
jgi:hypothetical protein